MTTQNPLVNYTIYQIATKYGETLLKINNQTFHLRLINSLGEVDEDSLSYCIVHSLDSVRKDCIALKEFKKEAKPISSIDSLIKLEEDIMSEFNQVHKDSCYELASKKTWGERQ